MFKKAILGLILTLFIVSKVVFAADGRIPTIYNVTLTSANTEYSQKITPGTKKFTVQARSAADVRLAFETGKVAASTSPYMTIKSGNSYWEDNLDANTDNPITLYLATGSAGTVVEVVVWR